jgi:cytochrome c-type biogenesis protein CcmE
MRRKSFWLSVALVVAISGTVLTTLALLTQHAPAFYLRTAVAEGEKRKDLSASCVVKVGDLIDAFRNSDPGNLV